MISDADAVARAVAGDSDAFGVLVHRYVGVARAVALAVVRSDADADDVVQDAFLIAFRELRASRPPADFRSWFMRIVRNRAYNVADYRRVRRYEPLSGLEVAPSDGDPVRRAEGSDARAAIMRALGRLKPVQREVVWLHDVEGLTHAEIARTLSTSELMSRKHLMKARQALRHELRHHRGDS
jgi:RNA polymerase sigma-70 factor (ECF subfamily)